jgi:3-methyladenine DNA glycosylase/8-oxoguanine DNA glycosylase
MPDRRRNSEITAALRQLRRAAGPMPALIARHGPPPLRRTRDSFASLGRAIIYQQLSGKAADTIYRRFLALFPGARFPRPAELSAVSPGLLRSVGLSQAKATYLQALATAYLDGTVQPRRFSRLPDEQISAMLTRVRGIGQWSADMFLIFGLNRLDVLPVGDLGVRKGLQLYFGLPGLPGPGEMSELTASWRPYRSIGSWYMWRVVEEGLP